MEILQQLGAVVLVLALLLVAARKFGRRSPATWIGSISKGRKQALVRSDDRVRLTPQHSVHVIAAGASTLLVGCHAGGMTILADLTPQPALKTSDASMPGIGQADVGRRVA